jgi:hypothetical protein
VWPPSRPIDFFFYSLSHIHPSSLLPLFRVSRPIHPHAPASTTLFFLLC